LVASKIIRKQEKSGTDYAVSKHQYFRIQFRNRKTTNRTEENLGYDTAPQFSPTGNLTWLQMKKYGYEADKMT
jgi:hypothetical protein